MLQIKLEGKTILHFFFQDITILTIKQFFTVNGSIMCVRNSQSPLFPVGAGKKEKR
jgi:hypothetical protein